MTMKISIKTALEHLWYYLGDAEVFVEWDELEKCYIVDSRGGLDISKFHHVEDAFEWALEEASGDYDHEN